MEAWETQDGRWRGRDRPADPMGMDVKGCERTVPTKRAGTAGTVVSGRLAATLGLAAPYEYLHLWPRYFVGDWGSNRSDGKYVYLGQVPTYLEVPGYIRGHQPHQTKTGEPCSGTPGAVFG